MKITRLAVQDFRNLPLVTLDFSGTRQFFFGRNGQGKTNLLEALGLVSALRSFRTNELRPLIRRDQREARLRIDIDQEETGTRTLEIHLRSNGKKVLLDGEKTMRLRELLGLFPTVVLSADDAQLLRGAPSGRRRMVDMTLSSIDKVYFQSLKHYHQALRQRNALLKQDAHTDALLMPYEQAMAKEAANILQKRADFIPQLAKVLREKYAIISDGASEAPDLIYLPKTKHFSSEELLTYWSGEARRRDFAAGTTTAGPHRDDVGFSVNGGAAEVMGSEGQQRGLVVSLRLAQAALYRERLGILPVILADDVLGEFDPDRRRRFWEALSSDDYQVIATGTVLPTDEASWQVFGVEGGKVTTA